MKKHALFFAVPVLMAVMSSGSVWEGAAALSSNGELPDSGYYAASSSFPRNTVVDVTNLETRKTVRVIVAGPLESPGLLALLSRDAASSIGLSSRSVGRIRISQPADPVAFSRFTSGGASSGGDSGDSDFDPRAAVAANYPHLLGPVDGAAQGSVSESYTGMAIVDLPRDGFTPASAGSPDEGIQGEPEAESAWVYPEEIAGGSALAETSPPENLPPENLPPETGYDLPDYTAPPGEPELAEERYEDIPEYEVPHEVPPELSEMPFSPPEEIPGELPEVTQNDGVGEPGIISEITLIPAEERPPEYTGEMPGMAEYAPVTPEVQPGGIAGAPSGVSGAMFSVPLISQLENGKYYLQLGAYSYTDLVEAELSRLGRTYPLAVQLAGAPERPLYRILVGPVNMGESGALLQRFKNTGYSDAFIRSYP
ncbi:MAG: SPOR domain-containing protein [Spirochaetaceae bacterium]|jgi:hypothetical protein|nr:SPOR domain-containing protein [Spirochaetaceae bacterium]